jgi:hypothetical protein
MKRSRQRRMQVEGLETRQMMAGDVSVVLSPQRVLNITGDAEDNGVAIYTEGNVFKVMGLVQGGEATTVNGNHRISFKNVRNIVVNLGDGNDAFAATNTKLAASLTINMGDGDDLVGIGSFDNRTIEEEYGLKYTVPWMDEELDPLIGAFNVRQDLTINLGDGDNELRGRAGTIGRRLRITSGDGDDNLRIESGGISNDTVIMTGAGKDDVLLKNFATRNLTVYTEEGNDKAILTDLVIKQELYVSAGDDQDQVHVANVAPKRLKVYADAGDDDTYFKNVKPKFLSYNDGNDGDNVYHDLGGNAASKVLRLRNYNTLV